MRFTWMRWFWMLFFSLKHFFCFWFGLSWRQWCTRDDHYPVCRLDIRQDSEFATGYGYSKSETITIRFAGWISGRIVSLQPDKDIQNLLSNGIRIRIGISETLLSIFRGFRLLEKVAHCTILHLLSSEVSFQPSAPWLRVCLWCNLWTVELCQVCQHESLPGVAR